MQAIISGASRGIGKATAKAFGAAAYDLILISRTEEDLLKVRDEILEEHSSINVNCIPADLSASTVLEKLKYIKWHKDELILVNNLGQYAQTDITNLDLEKLRSLMSVNVESIIRLSEFMLPQLKQALKALIINICSVNSIQSDPRATAYAMSKHAMKAWNDALREELRSQGIKVSAIYPGAVNTSSWDGTQADRASMIHAEDVAQMAVGISRLSPTALVEEIRMMPTNLSMG